MNLFDLAARLTLDARDYEKGLNDAEGKGSSFASKLGSVLGSVGKVAATGITAAAGAITALTKSAVDGYANYEQLKGGVETLFKTSASTVMNYASQAYKTAGMSANEYMETTTSFAASLIQSLGGDTQAAADVADRAIRDMSDNANKMGTDMTAIQVAYQGFSKQNYTMLDNLKLGYGGTKTEMERLIADASKMKDVQGELNVTVQEGDLSFANIVNAISVMQKHLDITGTTAAEASSTISGSINSMKASWDNLLVGLGDDTQDMGVLINQFVESTVTILGNLVPRIQTILEGIGELVTRMVGVLAEQLPTLIQSLLPPLLSAATTLFTALAAAIPELLQIILEQLPTVVDSIVAVIPMIVEGLLALLPTLLEVGIQIIVSLVEGIAQSLPELIPAAVEAVTTLIETLYNNLPLIIEAGLKLLEGLIQGIINAIPKLVAALPKIITAMTNYFTQSIPKIVQSGVKLLEALVQNLPQIISTIIAAVPQIITALVNFFTQSIPTIVQAGVGLLTSLIKNLPTIIKTIVAAVPQIITSICSTLSQNIPAIVQAGVEVFTSLITNLPEIIATIISAVPDIITSLVTAFAESLPSIIQVGTDLVKGIFTGIKNASEWLWNKLTGWVDSVIGWIKGLFGIHSPSTVMRDQIGRMMGRGVAEGIEDSVGDVKDASEDLLGAIPDLDNRDFSVNVRRNLSDSYSGSMEAVVAKMEDIMNRFSQTVILELNDRELGRAVRGYV